MSASKPTKASIKPREAHVHAVTNHRIGEGTHSHVFPMHVGESHWHPTHRNGHPGSHSVTSKGRK